MTTGRINQVRTVGGAGAPAAPRPGGPDGSACAPRPGLAPGPLELCRRARARARPRPGPGGFGRPGATPRASGERALGRGPSGPGGVAPAGARSPTPGLRRPCLAGLRPRLLLLPSRSRSERRRRHASSRGAPLGTVRPRTVTRTKACDPLAAASALPLGRPPPAILAPVRRRVETGPGREASGGRRVTGRCFRPHGGLAAGAPGGN